MSPVLWTGWPGHKFIISTGGGRAETIELSTRRQQHGHLTWCTFYSLAIICIIYGALRSSSVYRASGAKLPWNTLARIDKWRQFREIFGQPGWMEENAASKPEHSIWCTLILFQRIISLFSYLMLKPWGGGLTVVDGFKKEQINVADGALTQLIYLSSQKSAIHFL